MKGSVFLCFLALFAASSSQECGKRFHDQQLDKLTGWIVGGVTALKGAYPYQVSFEYHGPYIPTQHICGATIINSNWIITAAHCIIATNGEHPSFYRVVVGRHSLKHFDEKTKRHSVQRVIVHPKWGDRDEPAMSNDIALIKVAEPIEFNEFVQPACLPDDYAIYKPETMALISGWGEMDPKTPEHPEKPGRAPTVMRAASVPLLDWNKCKNANNIYQEMITKTMTCAGYMDGAIDGCQGDSGGPLVKIVDGRATLVGVVSWGIGCAAPKYPGVYTNVFYELAFIRKYIH